jgi:heme-degrading monooxygenase HmoA
MDEENQLFSVGIWRVKSGKEKDFIATFGAFAEWVFDRNLGAEEVYLLQDIEQPSRFITCGPWESIQKIEEWRKLPEFKEFFVKAKSMSDEVTPLTMKSILHLERSQ